MSPLRESREIQILLPEGWARPSGYSHGVLARGRYVFVAGQVGWNPITSLFETNDFIEQIRQSLRNIVSVLGKAGAEPRHIVRLTWFITHPDDYKTLQGAIGEAYAEIIGRHYPAMSVVVVDELLETDAKVEIEATAVIPDPQ
jgi:enamine deaminase RidA (YjgF/YER057c/UK114 family)